MYVAGQKYRCMCHILRPLLRRISRDMVTLNTRTFVKLVNLIKVAMIMMEVN